MKSIKDILQRKIFSSQGAGKRELDEKTVIKVFEEAVLSEIKNLFAEDLREIYLKKKIIYVKTAHPAVASEIWRKREKIKNKSNHILGSKEIKEIKVK
ncbi:MAG: DciA family protein [Candidatus Moranbacteria bacterium]|nr:DciA family protein [Candidatus Moranbacteria bacterium]